MMCLLVFGGGNSAWAEDISKTFNLNYSATETKSEDWTLTESPVTLGMSKGAASNVPSPNKEGSLRFYNGTTLTISTTTGTLKTVEFTYTSSSYPAAFTYGGQAIKTVDDSKNKTNTWTVPSGNTSVVLSATAACRFTKIVVTYTTDGGSTPQPTALSVPSNLSSSNITTTGATLSWDAVGNASSYTVKIGETEYTGVNTNSYSATGLTAGTQYTWTVKAVGDGTNYTTSDYASNKTFTTETEQGGGDEPASGAYKLVTSLDQLSTGSKVILACTSESKVASSAAATYLNQVDGTFNAEKTTCTPSKETLILTLGQDNNGKWTFADNTGKLLGATAVKSVKFDALGAVNTWIISISQTGAASITNTGAYGTMRYNASSPRFTTYASGQTDVQLFVEPTNNDPSKTTPTLSFAEETYNATKGETFTVPTLNNPDNVTVTYTSSKTDIATVNETTGEVSLVAPGTTKITASFAGDDTYNATSASYNLVVAGAKYTVTIETPANGTLTIKDGETIVNSGDKVAEGTKLTIEVEAADGYKFKNWQYKVGNAAWATRYTNPQNYDMPSANVQFRANCDPIPTYTIAWSVNGTIVKSEELKEGATVTAPATPEDINDKTFTGWVETSTVDADASPAYVTPSATAEKTVTYYAVFATTDGQEPSAYVRVTELSQLAEKKQIVVVHNSDNMVLTHENGNLSGTTQSTAGLNESDNKISIPNDNYVWSIGGDEENGWVLSANGNSLGVNTLPDTDRTGQNADISFTSSNNVWTIGEHNTSGCFYIQNLGETEGTTSIAASYYNGKFNVFTTNGLTSSNSSAFKLYVPNAAITYSDYTTTVAAPVPTYTLSEFIARRDDLTENDVFNVTIEDDITIVNTHDATDAEAKAYMVTISPDSYVWVSIYAPAPTPAKEWTVGGTLSGSLTNVTWNGSAIVGKDASVWEGLTYKPIPTYTLSELFGTPSKEHVNVEVDDVVESCEMKFTGTYEVTLKSGVSLIIHTDNLGWVADGTVKGTLNNVEWRNDPETKIVYVKDVAELTYTAPTAPEPTKGTINFAAKGVSSGGTDISEGSLDYYYATFSSDKDVIIDLSYNSNLVGVFTVCVEDDGVISMVLPEDYSMAEVTDQDIMESDGYVEGYYVPANTGVMLVSFAPKDETPEAVTYYYVAEGGDGNYLSEIDPDGTNMLLPSCTKEEMEEIPDCKFYKLSYGDEALTPSTLGFYWGAPNGGAFDSKPGMAFLAVPNATMSMAAPKGFRFIDSNTATGIKNVDSKKPQANAVYNLAGQRVSSKNFKGIVIKNGKKVLNK